MLFPFSSKLKTKAKEKENTTYKNNNKCIDIIKETIKNEANDYCFECHAKHPQYISINNSIFLCRECILNHLSLSQDASTIIKNDLKILTLNEIQYIYNGGNQKLLDFINKEFPKLKGLKPEIFYNTMAMDYYRKRLKFLTEGGDEPFKPTIANAYTLIGKSEDNEINDIENIISLNEGFNSDNTNDDFINNDDNYKYKGDEEKYNNYYINNTTNRKDTHTRRIFRIKENDNINNVDKTNLDLGNGSSINPYKKYRKISHDKEYYVFNNYNLYKQSSLINTNQYQNNTNRKNVTFKQNCHNFDNENCNYNYSYNKASETARIFHNKKQFNTISNNTNKKENDIYTKNKFFSPQPEMSSGKTKKIINNVYSKPKPITFFNKNKNAIKPEHKRVNSNKINIVFNINELNIEKNNLKENNKHKFDNNIEDEYTERMRNSKNNNYYNLSGTKKEESIDRKNNRLRSNIRYINRSQSKNNKSQENNKLILKMIAFFFLLFFYHLYQYLN